MDFKTDNFEKFYESFEEIGSGHFAVVRRCCEKQSGIEYAAKFIRKKRAQASRRGLSPEDIEREVGILKELDGHPNVIGLKEVFDNGNIIILVLELVRGGELFDVLLENRFLHDRMAAHFIKQVLYGLEHMHAKSIGHLDLKPENIMIKDRESNHIKIIDFGLARRLKGTTVSREMMGTPEFVAPEIINFDPITLATDMWSLGVITYILLSGASPFLGSNRQETFENIVKIDYSFDDEYFSLVSLNAMNFIKRLLVADPRKRLTVKECLNHPWIKDTLSLELELPYNKEFNDEDYTSYLASQNRKSLNYDEYIQGSLKNLNFNNNNNNNNNANINNINPTTNTQHYNTLPRSSLINHPVVANIGTSVVTPLTVSHDKPLNSSLNYSFSYHNILAKCEQNQLNNSCLDPNLDDSEIKVLSNSVTPVETSEEDCLDYVLNDPNNLNNDDIAKISPLCSKSNGLHTSSPIHDIEKLKLTSTLSWKNTIKLVLLCGKIFRTKSQALRKIMDSANEKTLFLAFNTACREGNLLAIQELFALSNLDFLAFNESGINGIDECIQYGHVDILEFILKTFPQHPACIPLEKYLFRAITYNQIMIFDSLLSFNNNGSIDVNVYDMNGLSLLHNIILMNRTEILHLLIHNMSLDVNAPDLRYGNTALHFAVLAEAPDLVQCICQNAHLNPNLTNKQGQTPLHLACCIASNEGTSIVRMLCNVFIQSTINTTKDNIMHFTLELDLPFISSVSNNNNIGTNHTTFKPPLHLAISRGANLESCLILIDAGANIEACDELENRPIHLAVEIGQYLLVQTLCAYGCQVNVANKKGLYPIHIAARYGWIEVCRCLCLACCDINVRIESKMKCLNTLPCNAIEIAKNYGHQSIVEMLTRLNMQTVTDIPHALKTEHIYRNAIFHIKNESNDLLTNIKQKLTFKSEKLGPKKSPQSDSAFPYNNGHTTNNGFTCLQSNLIAQLLPLEVSKHILLSTKINGNVGPKKDYYNNASSFNSNTLCPSSFENRIKMKIFGHSGSGKTQLIQTLANLPKHMSTTMFPRNNFTTFKTRPTLQSKWKSNNAYNGGNASLSPKTPAQSKMGPILSTGSKHAKIHRAYSFAPSPNKKQDSPQTKSNITNNGGETPDSLYSRIRQNSFSGGVKRLLSITTTSHISPHFNKNYLETVSTDEINHESNNDIYPDTNENDGLINYSPKDNVLTWNQKYWTKMEMNPPKIGIQNIYLKNAGFFNTWKFPQNPLLTQFYDQFVGDVYSIHVIVFDASLPLSIICEQIFYWCTLLAICHKYNADSFLVCDNRMEDGQFLESNLLRHKAQSTKRIPLLLIGTHLDILLSPATITSLEILRQQILTRLADNLAFVSQHFDLVPKIFFLDLCSETDNAPPFTSKNNGTNGILLSSFFTNGDAHKQCNGEKSRNLTRTTSINANVTKAIQTRDKLIINNFIMTEWMDLLEYLEYTKYEIIQNLPKPTGLLAASIATLREWSLIHNQCPIMPWPLFIEHVRERVNCLASDDHLQELVMQLELLGEVLYVKSETKVDMVVLDPSWLCSEILSNFVHKFTEDFIKTRDPNDATILYHAIPLLNLDEISDAFKDSDIVELLPLLESLNLCNQCQTPIYNNCNKHVSNDKANRFITTNTHNNIPVELRPSNLEYEFPCLNMLHYALNSNVFQKNFYIPNFSNNESANTDAICTGYRYVPCTIDAKANPNILTEVLPRIQHKFRLLLQENVDYMNNALYQFSCGSKISSSALECLVYLVPIVECNDADINTNKMLPIWALDIIARGQSNATSTLFYFINDVLDIIDDVITAMYPGLTMQKLVFDHETLNHYFGSNDLQNDSTQISKNSCNLNTSKHMSNVSLTHYSSSLKVYDAQTLYNNESYCTISSTPNKLLMNHTTESVKTSLSSASSLLFLTNICIGSGDLMANLLPWWDMSCAKAFQKFPFLLKYLCLQFDETDTLGRDWCLLAISLGLAELLPYVEQHITPTHNNCDENNNNHHQNYSSNEHNSIDSQSLNSISEESCGKTANNDMTGRERHLSDVILLDRKASIHPGSLHNNNNSNHSFIIDTSSNGYMDIYNNNTETKTSPKTFVTGIDKSAVTYSRTHFILKQWLNQDGKTLHDGLKQNGSKLQVSSLEQMISMDLHDITTSTNSTAANVKRHKTLGHLTDIIKNGCGRTDIADGLCKRMPLYDINPRGKFNE